MSGENYKIERQTQVNEQMGLLNSALHELSDFTDGLEGRLEIVLPPQTPIPEPVEGPPNPEKPVCLVPLAGELKGFVLRVQVLTERIRSAQSRMEL